MVLTLVRDRPRLQDLDLDLDLDRELDFVADLVIKDPLLDLLRLFGFCFGLGSFCFLMM